MDNKRSTPLEIKGTETQIEEAKDFYNSYFRDEYSHIFCAIKKIISHTKSFLKKERKDNVWGCHRPDNHIRNIVPIIGKRGSGKTSVMLSVAGALKSGIGSIKNVESKEEFSFFERFIPDLSNIKFIVLDPIDGSLLEPDEDIFKVILALMYRKIKDMPDANNVSQSNCSDYLDHWEPHSDTRYRLNSISSKFEALYNSYRLLGSDSSSREKSDDMALYSLKQISSSLTIREDFLRLLKVYLDVYSANVKSFQDDSIKRNEQDDQFLVIPIDDMDMNIQHGYEMLEKVHRYLMLPNVIILMAFNYDQLCRLCENKFYEMIPKFDRKLNISSPRIEELARQYLDKVLPLDVRTYIPTLDSRLDAAINIRSSYNNHQENYKSDKAEYSPKQLIFHKLFEKLGIRVDTSGSKFHFFIPGSLRSFVSFYLLLDGMHTLSKNVNREELLYNKHIMNEDIKNRYTSERLRDTPYSYSVSFPTYNDYVSLFTSSIEKFERIFTIQDPLPWAFKELIEIAKEESENVNSLLSGLTIEDNIHEHRLIDLGNELQYYGYSYGEILHILYEYEHLDEQYKELSRCLRGYFSLALAKSFLNYKFVNNNDEKEKKEEKEKLLESLGKSIVGGWANMLFGSLESQHEIGLRKLKNNKGSKNNTGLKVDSHIISSIKNKLIENNELIEDKTKQCFYCFLLLGMFFDNSPDLSPVLKWTLKDPITSGVGEKIEKAAVHMLINDRKFHLAEGGGVFDALGFVSNAAQWDDKGDKQGLLDSIGEYIEKNCKANESQKTINKVKNDIIEEFTNWNNKYGGFALPIQNIDVCYSVLKHLKERCEEIGKYTKKEDLLKHYWNSYKFIAGKLKDNDTFYEGIINTENTEKGLFYSYYNAFCECPYMKWLGISIDADFDDKFPKTDDSSYRSDFDKLFGSLIDSLINNSESLNDPKKPARYKGFDD